MTESQAERMITKSKKRTLGPVLRERRRQLDLTQQEVARRIKTSTPYVGHLEADKRRPSNKVLTRLADVLGLSRRDLFILANPRVVELLGSSESDRRNSAWDLFRRDEEIRRVYHITVAEIELLSKVALMGDVISPRDFLFILNAVRHALGR
jgi:transcriptional regulator with XRE-family HTH domain